MTTAFMVAPRSQYRRPKPTRNSARRAFCRRLPCIACRGFRYVEAAHVGPHGLGQKADDFDTLPICRWHHRISDYSLHALGPAKFQERYHLSFEYWLKEINEWYTREIGV